jgi:hypothetical protein
LVYSETTRRYIQEGSLIFEPEISWDGHEWLQACHVTMKEAKGQGQWLQRKGISRGIHILKLLHKHYLKGLHKCVPPDCCQSKVKQSCPTTAMQAPRDRRGIAPTHSWPWH